MKLKHQSPATVDLQLRQLQAEKDLLFIRLSQSAWLVCAFYTVFYSAFQATFSAISLAFGTFVLLPIALHLNRRGLLVEARVMMLASVNLVIFLGSAGIGHKSNGDYYYFPALMAPLLVFDSNQRKAIFLTLVLPIFFWSLTQIDPSYLIHASWIVTEWNFELNRMFNFYGACAVVTVFVFLYIESAHQLKKILTDHVREEAQIFRELHQNLEEAQMIARIGSWSWDFESRKFDWSNEMFGLLNRPVEAGPMSDQEFFSALDPEDRESWQQSLADCKSSGAPFRLKVRIHLREQVLWASLIGKRILNSSGEVGGVRGVLQDITEAVLKEKQLAIEKAKSLHSAKLASLGEMAAGIAHEINNPLAVIVGNLSRLQKSVVDPKALSTKIEVMLKSAARVEKIVSGLRKFSRIDNGGDFKVESLAQLARESLTLIEGKANRFGVQVQLKVNSEAWVSCNAIEIEQVIVNLLSNGIDAAKAFASPWVRIEISEEDNEVVLRVLDSGGGISPALEQKMFDPFFTTKPVGEGTGLGLSISKGILEQHKAHFQINRNFSNTCFEVRFAQLMSSRKVS